MSDIEDRIKILKKSLSTWRTELTETRGAKTQLIEVRDTEVKLLGTVRDEQQLSSQAHMFLLSEITERREQAIQAIENMASAALRQTYGPGYALRFETFEDKRKEGDANFKMEIRISSPHEGKSLETGLLGERGGGVIEVVAFALRMAALNWLGYDGPLIIDEAWKSMSNDHKIEEIAKFLRDVTDNTGRQVIFATHKSDVFGNVADRIIRVEKTKDGLATVEILAGRIDDEEMEEEF